MFKDKLTVQEMHLLKAREHVFFHVWRLHQAAGMQMFMSGISLLLLFCERVRLCAGGLWFCQGDGAR